MHTCVLNISWTRERRSLAAGGNRGSYTRTFRALRIVTRRLGRQGLFRLRRALFVCISSDPTRGIALGVVDVLFNREDTNPPIQSLRSGSRRAIPRQYQDGRVRARASECQIVAATPVFARRHRSVCVLWDSCVRGAFCVSTSMVEHSHWPCDR